MKRNRKILNGYIEGYYGRLLSWEDRHRIVMGLNKNKMNYYFYAPKEDEKHRLNWKSNYKNEWTKKFKIFADIARKNYVKIIVGISPGYGFDFSEILVCNSKNKESKDLRTLYTKFRFFIENGADEIALLFDDLPNNFKETYDLSISEGYAHAYLANKLSLELKKNIFVVPRIYSDQLIYEDKNYLLDFKKEIDKNIICFYSGKNIVSKSINNYTLQKTSNIFSSNFVIWDNFYSNDYCPRRIFLGPYYGRNKVQNIMINPTGLIETDLLLLDIVKATKNSLRPYEDWKKILDKHRVPSQFLDVCNHFLKPDFGDNPVLNKISISKKFLISLDFLIWKWKSPLSREWYPFLLGLKHDIKIFTNNFNSERVIKTQTKALANYLLDI